MRNNFTEMSLEDLWELFPIVLTPHRNEWKEWATGEITSLYTLLSGYNPVINHIGSTAIPDIQAKPIIDILVEMPDNHAWPNIRSRLESTGYICMSYSDNRLAFNKGYTADGYAEKVFHIHFHIAGDNDEIAFRDYLIEHPAIAHEYELLKLSLLPRYKNDRDGYTEAKTEFVTRITDESRKNITNQII